MQSAVSLGTQLYMAVPPRLSKDTVCALHPHDQKVAEEGLPAQGCVSGGAQDCVGPRTLDH